MSKQLRFWLFVLLGTLLTSTFLFAEGVITMTTSKAVGERIAFAIKANGGVTIEDAKIPLQPDGYFAGYYTLSSQTVTIRGDVTELDCSDNQLTSLDVSGCTSLTRLSCSNNQLTSLDVSGCTSLTKLDCYGNQLTSLDVSKNTALTKLECYDNRLTSLNLSTCLQLNYVDCSANQIKGVAMTQLVASLPTCSSNQGQFGSFIVVSNLAPEGNVCSKADLATARAKNWISLKRVDWRELLPYEGEDDNLQVGNGLITMTTTKAVGETIALAIKSDGGVTIEGVKAFLQPDGRIAYYILTSQTITIRGDVTKLYCSSNQLTSLDVSDCSTLTALVCYNNQLTSLNVSGCTALTTLDCQSNQLTSLDVSGCTALTSLDCSRNQLTSLDVSGCTSLTKLECQWNQLTSLDVSGCTALTALYCGGNQLTSLDLSKNTALTELTCYRNQLTSLDVSGCTTLTKLECNSNQLTSLNVSQNTALTTLQCYNNQLTSLDVSGCTALTTLDCWRNSLTNLDLSKNTALTSLDCSNNQLTSLDVSGCTALTKLYCGGNQLTSLDLSKNTALTKLYCHNSQLTSLDLSTCSSLNYVDCSENQIKGESMTQLVASLPTCNSGNQEESGEFIVVSNSAREGNFCSKANVASARAKNWTSLKSIDENLIPYKGESDNPQQPVGSGIIKMTTTRAIGETIKLGFKANGEVVIEGAKTPLQPDGQVAHYTLTSQTIIIRGDLTEFNCAGSQLASLDVSDCPSLIKLSCGIPSGEKGTLTSLKASGCTALTELDYGNNPLISLDVSGCTSLTQLVCGSSWGERGALTSLNASGCTALKELQCQNNQLTSLDVSGCAALTQLDCGYNRLTSLDLSGCASLTELNCGYNQLTSLDLSHSSALIELNCYGNALTSLDLSKCLNLRYVDCSTNRIKGEAMNRLVASLPTCSGDYHGRYNNPQYGQGSNYSGGYFVAVSSSDNEWNLCSKENIATARAKNWTPLNKKNGFKYYNLELVPYEGVDLNQPVGHGVITMTTERAVGESITLLFKAKGGVALEGVKEILQSDGSTTYQILSGQTITFRGDVTALSCGGSELTSLNVSGCPSLTQLDCWNNKLTNLDVSQNRALQRLVCYKNQLTSLDVSQNSFLALLFCGDNQLTNLDISQNVALTWLLCYNNQLTSLDVSQNTALIQLYCGSNQLTNLDVSQNLSLYFLRCQSNQLTSLDLSHNSKLMELYCYYNQIKGAEMTKLVNGLPKLDRRQYSDFYVVVKDSIEGNVCLKSDVAIVEDKGWTPRGYNISTEVWEYYGGRETDSFGVSLTHEGEGVLDATGADDLKAVPYGTKLTITATPAEGYELAALTANGVDILESKSFVVTGYTEIKATFTKKHFVVTLPQEVGGTIRARGAKDLRAVPYGTELIIEATPAEGYELTTLTANGQDILATRKVVITEATEIKATFVKKTFVVTLPQEIGGTIRARGAKDLRAVPYGTELIIEATPAEGYELTTLTANGQDILATRKVVVTEATEIKATFVKKTFVVTLEKAGEGDLSTTGIDNLKKVPYGTELTIIATPAEGSELKSIVVDGVNITATKKVVIKDNVTVKATFTKKTFTVTLTKEGEGTITATGASNLNSVAYGTELTIVATPAAGYELQSLVADGVDITATKKIVVTDNLTVKATFTKKTFAVKLTKEGEGTITATGATSLNAVAYGTELTINATPAEGYELTALTANGTDILATKKVTVQGATEVKATFTKKSFAVTLTKEGEGTITATGASNLNSVAYGTELTIVATPAEGYKLTALTANGTDILATKKVVIKGATEVKATFVDHTGVETTVTQQVKLYPNPATDYVIVEGVAPASEVTLHSMTGERLYAGRADDLGTLQIDLTPYADGVYLVCVAGDTYRVVVRR